MADFSAFTEGDPQDPYNPPPPIYDPTRVYDGKPPVVPPVVTGKSGGGGNGVAIGAGDHGPQFDFSAFPRFNPHTRFDPLTLDQARNEPGYQFAEQQGQQGIERSAAAKGVLRTGGTLKDIGTWINDFATRNYGDANQREFQRQMANYGVEKDMYAPILAESQARYNAELQRGLAQYGRYTTWNDPHHAGGGFGIDTDPKPRPQDYHF